MNIQPSTFSFRIQLFNILECQLFFFFVNTKIVGTLHNKASTNYDMWAFARIQQSFNLISFHAHHVFSGIYWISPDIRDRRSLILYYTLTSPTWSIIVEIKPLICLPITHIINSLFNAPIKPIILSQHNYVFCL